MQRIAKSGTPFLLSNFKGDAPLSSGSQNSDGKNNGKSYYPTQRRHFAHHAIEVGISENEADKLIAEIIDATESVNQKVYQLLSETCPRELTVKYYKGCISSPLISCLMRLRVTGLLIWVKCDRIRSMQRT